MRQQADFATRFAWRPHQHPLLGAGGQRGDRRRLSTPALAADELDNEALGKGLVSDDRCG